MQIECSEKRHVLETASKKLLADQHRSERKPRLTAEQKATIFKTACEDPSKKQPRCSLGRKPAQLATDGRSRDPIYDPTLG